jgi:rhodanese-related sulfurtransferase
MYAGRRTIHDLLAAARERLDRVAPEDALAAVRAGALLVDIRSEFHRGCDGVIPGAAWHPRNVLEWRLDPASGHDDAALSADLGRRIVLVCDEGYQSSLAAATLQDLGFARATDLVGGFQAWRAAGLPVAPLGATTARLARGGRDEVERAAAHERAVAGGREDGEGEHDGRGDGGRQLAAVGGLDAGDGEGRRADGEADGQGQPGGELGEGAHGPAIDGPRAAVEAGRVSLDG